MLSFLPGPFLATITSIFFISSVIFWAFILFYPILLLKIILTPTPWRKYADSILTSIGECWVATNNSIIKLTQKIEWDVETQGELSKDESYLITANHQSWVDIVVLQRMFTGKGRAPFPRFFIKQELIWVPILGLCWWALDFPFMKRFSREYLDKNPHMRGKDIEATRKACAHFKEKPVSIINFFEGTRFTSIKQRRQQSPFNHLLKPRAGGAAFTLSAMDGSIKKLIDVTIVYPSGEKQFGDLFTNRVRKIIVRTKVIDIPENYLSADYENDEAFREDFQNWINDLWLTKDQEIEMLLTQEHSVEKQA